MHTSVTNSGTLGHCMRDRTQGPQSPEIQFGSVRDVSPMQSQNAFSPTILNEFDSVREESERQCSNALAPTTLTEFGIVTEVRCKQYLYADNPTFPIPSGRTTLEISPRQL